jgi:hypothetical protein
MQGKGKAKIETTAAANNRLRGDELGSHTEYNVSNCSAKPPWACVDGGMQQLVSQVAASPV